jgi:16S rRNA (cytosine967-C5)-methyltransferase
VLPFSSPADAQLKAYFRDHPKLGINDRAFVAEAVYTVLRRLRSLKYFTASDDSRLLVLAALVKYLGCAEADRFATAAEARCLAKVKAVDLHALPLAIRAEIPDWTLQKLSKIFAGKELIEASNALNSPAPLDLRVNSLLADRDEVLAVLHKDGIAAQPTPFSPFGIRLSEHPAINRHPLFLGGKIEVQEEASQLATLLVAPRATEMVVDFCAGAGGKTLFLGALMRSRGRLYAFDVSQRRLSELSPRLKRSGLSNVHAQVISPGSDTRLKRLAGKIDRVLVDAPCTGLGTLRRNPDLKWRQSPQSVSELVRKQAAILETASHLVKIGGRLVYATCSILPEENDAIVEAFLAAHPEFSLLDCSEILAARGIALDTGRMLRLFPHIYGTDGFFAAVLERTSRERPAIKRM